MLIHIKEWSKDIDSSSICIRIPPDINRIQILPFNLEILLQEAIMHITYKYFSLKLRIQVQFLLKIYIYIYRKHSSATHDPSLNTKFEDPF